MSDRYAPRKRIIGDRLVFAYFVNCSHHVVAGRSSDILSFFQYKHQIMNSTIKDIIEIAIIAGVVIGVLSLAQVFQKNLN